MVNLEAFLAAHKKYKTSEMPFLTKLLEDAAERHIYSGLKILHNTPLTLEAVLKIEPLVLGGADVTVSCIKQLPPQMDALEIIKATNLKLQFEHVSDEVYDIHLDCCADLVDSTPPRIGAVELTKTGSDIYKAAEVGYPIISVDDSQLKCLETFYGTGDGFVRALHQFVGDEMYGQSYMVFGFGKVGKGIVHALEKYTAEIIIVVDVTLSAFKDSSWFHMECIHGSEIQKIKHSMRNKYCIVTATGVGGAISQYYGFSKQDCGGAILANMGADDEYGINFSTDDILWGKKPLNFSLSEPTTMKYLDPIFYAHNLGIELLLSDKMKCGYNCFPDEVSARILRDWECIHGEKIASFIRLGADPYA